MNFGRYKIIKELGKGAMGVVYQAHDPEIDRLVALKVLREDRVASEYFVQRFFKEAKAIGRLSHPNIVTVYDVGKDRGTIYIAMEFLEGKPLDEFIGEKKQSLEDSVNIGVQLAKALGYAHKKGIIHRDIKPTNIIITSDYHIKLTDFGIARIEDPTMAQQTQAGEILGTPFYMSPEQITGQTVDGRSDLYSLGVFLYRIATGKKPFEGKTLAAIFSAITQDMPVAPSKVDSSISEVLSALIMKSLSKDPKDRFQTGSEMADALLKCLKKEDTKIITSKTLSLKEKKQPDSKAKNVGLLILILFFLASSAGGFIYYLVTKPPIPPSEKVENIPAPPPLIKREPPPEPPPEVEEEVAKGVLNIETIPTSADVFINGKSRGKTPLKLNLPHGKYEVRLYMENYYQYDVQIKLDKKELNLFKRFMAIDE